MSVKENLELERITMMQAKVDKFGSTITVQSEKLINHVETAGVITSRLSLEVESLRGVKESLRQAVAVAVKEQLQASSPSLSHEIFTEFSEKSRKLFEEHLFSISRANQNIKSSIKAWSALTLKQSLILVSSSVLVGLFTFFICHFFMPSQRLTQDEMNYMYYGQAYCEYMDKMPVELKNSIAVAANALRKTVISGAPAQ